MWWVGIMASNYFQQNENEELSPYHCFDLFCLGGETQTIQGNFGV